MSKWYYGKDNSQHGPISENEIRNLLSTKQIDPNTIIWCEGMDNWQPLIEVPEFSPTNNNANQYYAPPQQAGSHHQHYNSRNDGMAIASLVCGILGLILCGLFTGIPAIICGHISLSRIKSATTPIQGKGMAITGLILGYLSVILSIVSIIFFFFFAAAVSETLSEELSKELSKEQPSLTP